MLSNLVEIFVTFLRLGCTSFGGPVAHLAYFRNEFVFKKQWLSEQQYTNVVAMCQAIPGPASSQVGFAIGLIKGGWLGALCAFAAFTAPTVLLLILFAEYLHWFDGQVGMAVLQGLMIFAFVIVLQAVIGMAKSLCDTKLTSFIAVLAFAVLVIASSALGILLTIVGGAFLSAALTKTNQYQTASTPSKATIQLRFGNKTAITCLALFVGLFAVVPAIDSHFQIFSGAFYQAGALVFGGGHVVLPLLEAATVDANLVSENVFLAGYGATQAMPGPMFGFAGYLGYFLPNASGGISGAIISTIMVFLPGFLLIAALLPLWQQMASNNVVQHALSGANAAVVGLLAATLYSPIFTHAILDAADVAIAGIVFVAVVRFRWSILLALALCVTLRTSLLLI